MAKIIKAACIQMNSGPEIDPNLENVESLIRQAVAQGAQFVATPENTECICRREGDRFEKCADEASAKTIAFFAALADELGIWLLIGSLGVRVGDRMLANRSFLFSPRGKLVNTYDKIHMFDVKLSRTEFYNESKNYEAGERAVVADMTNDAWRAKLGMSICYDVRFPHLHRDLAKAGAQILSVPAAFTVPTGQAHWEVLLRARAIETGTFVMAPAQTGEHEGGRQTYGHSMIINPWGEILAAMGVEIGIITADLDMEEVAKARQAIPALEHDRDYKIEA